VKWINAGKPAQRVAALTSGKVAAVGSFLPDSLKLTGQGYHVIGKSSTFDGFHAQFDFIIANKNWVAKNHDTAVNFMRGYLKSLTWLMDPTNKDKAISDIAAEMKVDTDAATQTYNTFVTQLKMWPAQPADAKLDPASMLKAADYFTKAGLKGLPTTEDGMQGRYDNSLIEDAIKAGI
jgi:ABC-type nitrate/sulfonate/bicarbonate transport system substrate-binding protein